MEVRAIKRGFFGGQYRRPGDCFDCPSETFSSNWMEKVEEGMKPFKEDKYKPLEIPSLINKKRKKTKAKVATKLSLNKSKKTKG